MTLQQQAQQAQKIVDAWNARYSVGQPVVLKKDFEKEWTITTTRSDAQVVSCDAVVWLEGITGCYSLEVVKPLKAEEVF